MAKIKKHIEIVRSSIMGLSSMSQESCDAIILVLREKFASVEITSIDNLSDLRSLIARKPDLVFLGMESIPVNPSLGACDTNKIWITGQLELNGIAYTGSDQPAHMLQRDKASAKSCVIGSKILTPRFTIFKQDQLPNRDDINLTYPLFIKPKDRGGGLGVDSNSVAYNFEQLVSKVRSISSILRTDSIVEEYLPGREFSVAILKDEHSTGYSIMPIELIAPKDKNGVRILSDKVKSANTESAVGVSDEAIKAKVSSLAIDVFSALGARDYGRIDIRLDKNDEPYFLEANLIPSLISGYGSFPKACLLNLRLEYETMILRIAELGFGHKTNDSKPGLITMPSSEIGYKPIKVTV